MSDNQRHRTEAIKRGFATPASAVAIEVGDAVYHDGTNIQPASGVGYTSSPTTFALCQAYFAARSLGIALDASPVGKTAPVQFGYEGEWEVPCAALGAALKQGALFAPADETTGDTLEDQIVIEVHDPRRASAVLSRDAASGATAVWVRPLSGTERANLMAHVHTLKFPSVLLETVNDPAVTAFTFGKRVRILELGAIATVLVAADQTAPVIAAKKGSTELDDTLTVPTATARGAVVRQAIDDASGDDVFGAEDTLSIYVKTAGVDAGTEGGAAEPFIVYCDLGHTK